MKRGLVIGFVIGFVACLYAYPTLEEWAAEDDDG